MGASSYTYAEATADEQLASWIGAHVRAFEFFQGTPKLVIPDDAKTGITKACRHDPDLNPTYQEMAMHLRCGRCSGATVLAGQGQGRIGGAIGRTLDHRCTASSKVLFH